MVMLLSAGRVSGLPAMQGCPTISPSVTLVFLRIVTANGEDGRGQVDLALDVVGQLRSDHRFHPLLLPVLSSRGKWSHDRRRGS